MCEFLESKTLIVCPHIQAYAIILFYIELNIRGRANICSVEFWTVY